MQKRKRQTTTKKTVPIFSVRITLKLVHFLLPENFDCVITDMALVLSVNMVIAVIPAVVAAIVVIDVGGEGVAFG